MAVIKVTLTKDMINLISNFRFEKYYDIMESNNMDYDVNEEISEYELSKQKKVIKYGLDMFSLYGGSFLFEDMAYILGLYDKCIDGTQEDPDGPKFPDEIEEYMYETHSYIVENLENIEGILHQFAGRGGLTEGTYVAKDYELIWKKKE